MKTTKKPLREIPFFSSTFHAYLNQDPELRSFYGRYPNLEEAGAQANEKQFDVGHRQILHDVLLSQYEHLGQTGAVGSNIAKLKNENCYTVVTGHQLNLFTGPLYVILKMITTINACEELKAKYPDKDFVPVYWMASEDHDFDEINHFHFNGQKYTWETPQTGAVGRFSVTDMKPLLTRLSAFPPAFLNAYQSSDTLAEAVRKYMHSLFGEYGLVVLDADDSRLKSLFTQVMRDDILECAVQPLVADVSKKLDDRGFKTQVFAREVNFFFLEDGIRDRIERDGEQYRLAESGRTFSRGEMEQLISGSPEKLSPNVILRPLYQEMVLPNIAYCGGPSELIYWLQLRPVFDKYEVPFPILLPRNFAMIIPAHVERKWNKTRCSLDDLFLDRHELLNKATLRDSEREVTLNGHKEDIQQAFRQIQAQAEAIDPTMGQHVEAQWARTEKKLVGMEKKFIRAEKRHHDDLLRQICDVHDTLFPGGGLQERHDNLMNFLQTDPEIVGKLKEELSPFDTRFNIIHYGE